MTDSISFAVIEAVAEAKGVDSTELNPPLADIIDPDALESLFRSDTGEVRFTYHDCEVTVTCEGTVQVTTSNSNSPPTKSQY